ncbi:Cancer-related nucleoside-triphosphatase [Amphibalanus amphitrite]|uniref:Cancer-related nucleoside-triphosphatase n=1 Tax=Amphibalanus amphitrite TaxID=1232801 RepID=A0A6A4VJ27_AMPAM|nr:cancer-related nucleoside-triphosphatase homolog [Amphibalanus amphitrite]KAF0289441.1 Cancer-related nucleoside-triphosphatase [Amphibalanus amphitrite]
MNHLLITGVPGVGKTTVVQKALEQLSGVPAAGFVTEEVRKDGRRIGFDVISLGGERAPLARVGGGGGGGGARRPMVGQYAVDVASFERVALPALSARAAGGHRLLVLDEIGKMELLSSRFQSAVRAALDPAAGVTLVATIPVAGGRPQSGLLAQLRARSDARLLEVTRENRAAAVGEVVRFVRDRLARSSES